MSGQIVGAVTLVLLLAFVGGWVWAWSSKRRATFTAASRLPLEDDDTLDPPTQEDAR